MDSTVFGWIGSMLGSATVSAALVGLAAYLGRFQLSHWLQKDLEAAKAVHQRDLEAYKVSLIAEAERVKASQDVQKAIAVRIGEMKFAKLERLHHAAVEASVAGIVALWKVMHSQGKSDRLTKGAEWVAKVYEFGNASNLASPFLASSELATIRSHCAELSEFAAGIYADEIDFDSAWLDSESRRLFQNELTIQGIVEHHLSSMLNMR